MTFIGFVRLILRQWRWLLFFPLLLGGSVFYFTRSMPKEYATSSMIYTGIASGYTIASGEDSRVDYFAVNNAFDNLISTVKARQTVEEVGIRLLAQHLMLKQPDKKYLSQTYFDKLTIWIPESLRQELLVPGDTQATVQKIYTYKSSSLKNPLKDLLDANDNPYGALFISDKLKVERKSSSDMLELIYSMDDPGICFQTLLLLNHVFMKNYKGLKGAERADVVAYFERETAAALARLRLAEDRLKNFGIDNKIINYYEQTRYISEAKEELDKEEQDEIMKLAAAQAALGEVEAKLSIGQKLAEMGEVMLGKRKQLSDIYYQIANAEIYQIEADEVLKLQRQANQLETEIKQEVEGRFNLQYSKEGLPRTTVVEEWLSNQLETDRSEARLKVIRNRKKDFADIYEHFAPLGSTLKRLEREVDVNEKEYLSLLHSLNVSKLEQQNLEISSTLRVVDQPYFPLNSKASKRLLLIIASMVIGVFLVLGITVGWELLDPSLKTPGRAQRAVQLPLAGALPQQRAHRSIDLAIVEASMVDQVVSSIKLNQGEHKAPRVIALAATRPDTGIQRAAELIAQRTARVNGNVLLLQPEGSVPVIQDMKVRAVTYPITHELIDMGVKHLLSIAKVEETVWESVGYIMIQLPTLMAQALPLQLIRETHLSLINVDARKAWVEADRYLVNAYQQATQEPSMVLVNQVALDRIEEVMGEVPRKRSWLRKTFKRLMQGI